MRGHVVLIIAALAAAGCGGGDDDAIASSSTPASSEPTATDATAAESVPGSTDDATDDETTGDEPTTTTVARSTTTTTSTVATTTTRVPAPTTTAARTPTPTTAAPVVTPAPTAAPATTVAAAEAMPTTKARARIDALTSEAVASEAGQIDYDACPFDPTDGLLTEMFATVDSDSVRLVIDQPTFASTYVVSAGLPAQVTCDRYDDDVSDGFGVFAMQPPGDIPTFARTFADPDGNGLMDVTVSESGSAAGGEIFHACAAALDDPSLSYCEVYWSHPDLVVGAFVAGAGSTDVDLESVELALTSHVETIVANLAG